MKKIALVNVTIILLLLVLLVTLIVKPILFSIEEINMFFYYGTDSVTVRKLILTVLIWLASLVLYLITKKSELQLLFGDNKILFKLVLKKDPRLSKIAFNRVVNRSTCSELQELFLDLKPYEETYEYFGQKIIDRLVNQYGVGSVKKLVNHQDEAMSRLAFGVVVRNSTCFELQRLFLDLTTEKKTYKWQSLNILKDLISHHGVSAVRGLVNHKIKELSELAFHVFVENSPCTESIEIFVEFLSKREMQERILFEFIDKLVNKCERKVLEELILRVDAKYAILVFKRLIEKKTCNEALNEWLKIESAIGYENSIVMTMFDLLVKQFGENLIFCDTIRGRLTIYKLIIKMYKGEKSVYEALEVLNSIYSNIKMNNDDMLSLIDTMFNTYRDNISWDQQLVIKILKMPPGIFELMIKRLAKHNTKELVEKFYEQAMSNLNEYEEAATTILTVLTDIYGNEALDKIIMRDRQEDSLITLKLFQTKLDSALLIKYYEYFIKEFNNYKGTQNIVGKKWNIKKYCELIQFIIDKLVERRDINALKQAYMINRMINISFKEWDQLLLKQLTKFKADKQLMEICCRYKFDYDILDYFYAHKANDLLRLVPNDCDYYCRLSSMSLINSEDKRGLISEALNSHYFDKIIQTRSVDVFSFFTEFEEFWADIFNKSFEAFFYTCNEVQRLYTLLIRYGIIDVVDPTEKAQDVTVCLKKYMKYVRSAEEIGELDITQLFNNVFENALATKNKDTFILAFLLSRNQFKSLLQYCELCHDYLTRRAEIVESFAEKKVKAKNRGELEKIINNERGHLKYLVDKDWLTGFVDYDKLATLKLVFDKDKSYLGESQLYTKYDISNITPHHKVVTDLNKSRNDIDKDLTTQVLGLQNVDDLIRAKEIAKNKKELMLSRISLIETLRSLFVNYVNQSQMKITISVAINSGFNDCIKEAIKCIARSNNCVLLDLITTKVWNNHGVVVLEAISNKVCDRSVSILKEMVVSGSEEVRSARIINDIILGYTIALSEDSSLLSLESVETLGALAKQYGFSHQFLRILQAIETEKQVKSTKISLDKTNVTDSTAVSLSEED